jgi:ferritin-like metal-binding protein YciE
MKTLHDAFEHTLKDIYYAEKALVKAIPKMARKARSPALRQALEAHLAETEQQVQMLEQVFQSLGIRASAEKCDAIEGIIKEAEHVMKEADQPALDAMIVAGSQAVEHYEITRYGTLVEWAREMGHTEAQRILGQILDQEKSADRKLTTIAEGQVNDRANAESPASKQMAAQGGEKGRQAPR